MAPDNAAPAVHLAVPAGWELASISYCTPGLRLSDGVAGAFLFLVREGTGNFESAVRGAVQAWRESVTWAEHYGPNWGDAIEHIPRDHWAAHGLSPVSLPVQHRFAVDHDETFP